MLDWFEEEEQYVNKAIDNYLEKQSKMPLGFMISRKANNKNIEKVKKEAVDKYRFDKLMKYRGEIETERKRIDKVVEEINNAFESYMCKMNEEIGHKVRPFRLKVEEYNTFYDIPMKEMEIVRIYSEPFEIRFIQEKLESKGE